MTPPVDANYAALAERITGVESMVREIRDRQRFPWPAVGVGVGVITILMAFAMWGFNAYIVGTQNSILLVQQGASERMDRFEATLMKIDDGVVPRGEHEQRWRAAEVADVTLQRQIDEVRSMFGAAYSLNDTLASIVSRLDRLESLRLEQAAPTVR